MPTDIYQFDPSDMEEIEVAEELTCAPKGTYRVRVDDILGDKETGDLVRSKNDGPPFFMLGLVIVDKKGNEEEWKDFNMYVPIPNAKKWGKKDRNVKVRFREAHKAFGVPLKPDFSPLDFVGKEAEAVLDIESDPTYGDRNTVSNLILPK